MEQFCLNKKICFQRTAEVSFVRMMPDAKSKVINMLSMLPPLLESDIAGEGDDRDHHEWMEEFLEDITNKKECLSPRSKNLSSKAHWF